MQNKTYTDKENETIVKELGEENGVITKEIFIRMEEYWPNLFKITRTQTALFTQMIRLAKEGDILYIVKSTPKRNRKPGKLISPKHSAIHKLHDQVLTILRNELLPAEKKITRRIENVILDMMHENDILKKENKELNEFRRNVKITGGDMHSPLMEQYAFKDKM